MSRRKYLDRRRNNAHLTDSFETLERDAQLTHLETCQEQVKVSTYEAIHSHYRDFLSIRVSTTQQDPLDDVATLNDRYGLVQSSTNSGLQLERLDQLGKGLRSLVQLAKTHSNIKEIDDQILQGDVAVAASSLAEVHELLQDLYQEQRMGLDKQSLGLLQQEYVKKRAALKAELEYLLKEMYQIKASPNEPVAEISVVSTVVSSFDGRVYENPVTLTDVYFALTNLQLHGEKLEELSRKLVDNWFIPLLNNPKEPLAISQTKVMASMSIGSYQTYSSTDTNDTTSAVENCRMVDQKWGKVLEFIRDEVLRDVGIEEDHGLVVYASLGNKLWAVLCPLVQETLLWSMIPEPSVAVELADNGGMAPEEMMALVELEGRWVTLGFISDESSPLAIKEAVRGWFQTYVAKRRRDLLTTLAAVFATEDTNTVLVVSGQLADILSDYSNQGKSKEKGKGQGMMDNNPEEEGLGFEKCQISVQAQTLVEFVQETMGMTAGENEGELSKGTAASLYFHAVRDALVLYRCMVYGRWQGKSDARRAFVMYNDCQYICHHLSTLGYKYQDKWPAVFRKSVTLVDILTSYRSLSKTCLSPVLGKVREQLKQALGGKGQGWMQENWLVGQELEASERMLVLATDCLGLLAKESKLFLSERMHARVVGLLADAVVGCVVKRLAEVSDSVDDSRARQLARLLAPVVAIKDHFNGVIPVAKYCQGWEPFEEQLSRLQKLSTKHFIQ